MFHEYKRAIMVQFNKHFACLGVFSLVFAYVYNLTSRLHPKEGTLSAFRGIDLMWIFVVSAGYFICLVVLLTIISKFNVYPFKTINWQDRYVFIIVFGFIFVLYFICFLTFYPGVASYDTLYILMYDTDMSKQHPMAYCMLIRLIKIIADLFGNLDVAVFIYSILQILVMSIASAFSIAWLKKRRCPRFFILIATLYFGCIPIISMYAITMIKDSLFAAISILWIPLLVESVDTKGEWVKTRWGMICTLLLSLSIALLRSNGLYIVVPLLIYLAVRYKQVRKRYLILLLLTVLVGNLPNFYMATKGNQPLFQEKVGILIQQVSAVVTVGGVMNQEQEAFIEKIMPLEDIKDNYTPTNVDPIKWSNHFNREFLNENSKEFVGVWMELLPKNITTYVEAYLYQTYGFWQTKQDTAIFYTTLDSSSGDIVLQEFVADNNLYNTQVFPDSLQKILKNYYLKFSKFLSEGICFWILMTLGTLLLCSKKKYFIVIVPCLLNWITIMISTPIAMQFRYILMVPFSLILIMGIFFIEEKCEFKNKQK